MVLLDLARQPAGQGLDEQDGRLLHRTGGAYSGDGIHDVGHRPIALTGGDTTNANPFGRLIGQYIGIAYQQGHQLAHIGPDGLVAVFFGRSQPFLGQFGTDSNTPLFSL